MSFSKVVQVFQMITDVFEVSPEETKEYLNAIESEPNKIQKANLLLDQIIKILIQVIPSLIIPEIPKEPNSIKILGIQDFAMPSSKWLDPCTSLSWLNAWKKLSSEFEVHAVLRETQVTWDPAEPIYGIHYHFQKQHEFWPNLLNTIGAVQPQYILYNCWEYKKVADFIRIYKEKYPDCKHIIRGHHELERIIPREILDEINVADAWIVSTLADVAYLNTAQNKPTILGQIPFGVDIDYFVAQRGKKAKHTHFIASSGDNPVKQLPLLTAVFERLKKEGYTVRNSVGAAQHLYAEALARSHIYISFSQSEASGSRSLLEAIAAGCYPVIWASCKSAREVIASLNYGTYIEGTEEELAAKLEDILKGTYEPLARETLEVFTETAEVNALCDIFRVQCAKI